MIEIDEVRLILLDEDGNVDEIFFFDEVIDVQFKKESEYPSIENLGKFQIPTITNDSCELYLELADSYGEIFPDNRVHKICLNTGVDWKEFIFSEDTIIHKGHTFKELTDQITITTRQLGVKTLNRLEIKRLEEKINGEKNVMKKLHKFIFVRFADNKGNFNSYSKLYAYEIIYTSTANEIQIGSIIKAYGKYAVYKEIDIAGQEAALTSKHHIDENYRGCNLRVEGIADYYCEEIPLREWYLLNWYFATDNEKASHANKENWTNVIHWETDKINIEYVYKNNGVTATTSNIEDVLNHTNLVLSVDNPEKLVTLYYEGPSLTIDETSTICTSSPICTHISSPIHTYEPTIKPEEIKEDNKMSKIFDNIFKNVKFGTLDTDALAYSMHGIAFKDKDGGYFTYQSNGTSLDVTGMTIDAPLFIMPVALTDLKAGDIIEHKGDFMVVLEGNKYGIKVINPLFGEVVTRIPEVNIFGFNYVSKVINYFEGFNPNSSNPFGNLLPLMLLNDKSNDDVSGLLMMSMMGGNIDFASNPMMMYMLMSDKKDFKDILPFMMLSGNNPFMPKNDAQSVVPAGEADEIEENK